ncbi:MAG: hypothetical protein KKC29_00345 [Alphaproteobacteria bacterium]|jgi:hypothetical protein|nr:hypothetical protein [Alphaproteobacteria bacterium]MBU2127192.1 hypothetical protein [Alphaproteobacteria bacterium]MBU2207985.1 hypothetical protein [Alphaproteobacteria bacterium]MBU2289539.1 hypothetical protein [Alphaproteobacteria bacterium]
MAHAQIRDESTTPVSQPAADLVRRFLTDRLVDFGAYDVVLRPSSDHDGDAVVIVQVKHRLSDRPIDLKTIIETDREARDLAWANGEQRFLHLEHIYDPKQKVVSVK